MPNLYPEFDESAMEEAGINTEENPFKLAPYFDYETGDFVRQSGNKIRYASGIEAWEQWCMKAVMTKRYATLAYTDDYGSEILNALRSENREEAKSIIERTITETLMVDRRTDHIESIEFLELSSDGLEVEIVVVSIEGEAINFKVRW